MVTAFGYIFIESLPGLNAKVSPMKNSGWQHTLALVTRLTIIVRFHAHEFGA